MKDITQELREDFYIYANEVNTERAFPDVRDGLKPSQRAVLWEMFNQGYSSKKPHIKCARVDGGVIANWHPHGSEYSTMVRMSQPWINNIPEIDWHGANGSQQGGPEAAASRYTECRLSTASEAGFFSNINENTVTFIPNYSEDKEWPSVFPSIFPRLFVNGSQGIGYTIAQEWEPGNIKEFTKQVKNYISKGKIDCSNIFPDYPSGGVIINKKEIRKIYEQGKGNIILRAKTEIDGNIIKITELPYQTYAEPIISKIKDLVNSDLITGINDICNKSDDNGLMIEIECSGDPEAILNSLYRLTDLQVTFSANQMALVDGEPKLLTLRDYIDQYLKHNRGCILREYDNKLFKALNRKEILDGLVRAILMIDDIILAIKSSASAEEAKVLLKQKYQYSDTQAKAIVEMKLGRLASLEIREINEELDDLINTINYCNQILNDSTLRDNELINRLNTFTNLYGHSRRTQLTDIDLTAERKKVRPKKKEAESYIIALTRDNFIKKIKLVEFKEKANSDIISFVKSTSKDKVYLISEKGYLYKLPVKKINLSTMKSTGTSLEELFGEKILGLYNGEEPKEYFFFTTKNNMCKKVKAESIFKVSKLAGTVVMKLNPPECDKIINILMVDDNDSIKYTTFKGDKKISSSEFKDKGLKAAGVKLKKIKNEILKVDIG